MDLFCGPHRRHYQLVEYRGVSRRGEGDFYHGSGRHGELRPNNLNKRQVKSQKVSHCTDRSLTQGFYSPLAPSTVRFLCWIEPKSWDAEWNRIRDVLSASRAWSSQALKAPPDCSLAAMAVLQRVHTAM